MENALKRQFPRFINSTPAGEDLFEEKAQKRLSESICNLISDESAEINIIGLEGPWGSGKSNVIRMLGASLGNTHHLFIYDAWGHQEDLQRRAFLEELTENLCDQGLLGGHIWDKKLKDLLSKKQETVTKTIPQLSSGIIVALLLTFCAPFIKALTDVVDNKFWKMVIGLSPILIVLGYLVIQFFRTKNKFNLADFFYLYKERELENRSETITSTREPSVREFKNWMADLSAELSTKLIIVFDNMDRLPPEKVQTLWSSINTFFSDHHYSNIWVIIPFDREHIVATFTSKPTDIDQFINKTFPVVYRVAGPVLTDWQYLFGLKFREAFDDSEDSQFLLVRNIFDLMNPVITPRGIITFLNEIVVLKQLYGKEISLSYMAVFTLTKRHILEKPVDQILTMNFLGACESMFKDKDELQNAIAALTYNINMDSAAQVIFQREIQTVIREGDTLRFKELAQFRYFANLIEQLSFSATSGLDINLFVRCLAAIEPGWLNHPVLKEQEIWDRLNSVFMRGVIGDQQFTEASRSFLKYCSPDSIRAHVSYFITAILTFNEFDGGSYYLAISNLKTYLKEIESDIKITEYLSDCTMSPAAFLSYLEAAGEWDEAAKITCDEIALNDYLIKCIKEDIHIKTAIELVSADFNFERVIDFLKKNIDDQDLKLDKFTTIYSLYKAIATEKPIPLPADHITHRLLNEVTERTDAHYDLIAMRLSRGAKYVSSTAGQAYLQTSTDDDNEFVEEIASRIEYFITLNGLYTFAGKFNNALLKSAIQKLTDKTYGQSRLNIAVVLKDFKLIVDSFDLDAARLLKRVNPWAVYIPESLNVDNVIDEVPDTLFYETAVCVDNRVSQQVISIFLAYIKKLTIEDWQAALEQENRIYAVLVILLEANKVYALPDTLINAYKRELVHFANGKRNINPDSFYLIYEKINKTKLKTTLKNIRDVFINEGKINQEQFLFFFDKLLKHGELMNRAADILRTVLTPMIQIKYVRAIILNYREDVIELVHKAGAEANDFKELLKTLLAEDTSAVYKEFVDAALRKPSFWNKRKKGKSNKKGKLVEI